MSSSSAPPQLIERGKRLVSGTTVTRTAALFAAAGGTLGAAA
ncbi:hypothetical protein [Pseudomonas aeruginosa]